MSELIRFVKSKSNVCGAVASIPEGIGRKHGASQCQCDCYECAGGDTSDDR